MATAINSWVVICIPGRDENDDATWFAYDKSTRKSVRCESAKEAQEACAMRFFGK